MGLRKENIEQIMSHSFNKIWIHAIWSTKERNPIISNAIEEKIYGFLQKELMAAGCFVKIINGMPDHVHVLFLTNARKPVSEIIKQVKGCSSHSINEQDLIPQKFSWQTGYAAYSVSESQLKKVFFYIRDQKKHHEKKIFLEEYQELIALHWPSVDTFLQSKK